MRFPVFLGAPNDLIAFQSPEALSGYIEPRDVPQEYPIAFDSDGVPLRVLVDRRKALSGKWCNRDVAIVEPAETGADRGRFRGHLVRYVVACTGDPKFEAADWDILVEAALRYASA